MCASTACSPTLPSSPKHSTLLQANLPFLILEVPYPRTAPAPLQSTCQIAPRTEHNLPNVFIATVSWHELAQ